MLIKECLYYTYIHTYTTFFWLFCLQMYIIMGWYCIIYVIFTQDQTCVIVTVLYNRRSSDERCTACK